MKKSTSNEIKRGQAISFRVPSDTPDHLVKHLQKLKESERRNFSSKIAEFVMQGVGHSYSREQETITIPLPQKLYKSQRDWLKHEHSQALLGSIVYQLLTDPVRATNLYTSLISNSIDINEALYLQEKIAAEEEQVDTLKNDSHLNTIEEIASTSDINYFEDDDLDTFNWEAAKQNQSLTEVEEEKDDVENDLESLLGDFLAKMNK